MCFVMTSSVRNSITGGGGHLFILYSSSQSSKKIDFKRNSNSAGHEYINKCSLPQIIRLCHATGDTSAYFIQKYTLQYDGKVKSKPRQLEMNKFLHLNIQIPISTRNSQ